MNVARLRVLGSRYLRYIRDPHVPRWRRYLGLFAVAYFVFPVDLVPDFLPLLGWLDDVGVLYAAGRFMLSELEAYTPTPSGWPTPVERPPGRVTSFGGR